MFFLRKLLFLSSAVILFFVGAWLVVVNDQSLSLNLIVWKTPPFNAGFLIVIAFAIGTGFGVLLSFNVLRTVRLNKQLYGLKRDVRQLQEALHSHRDPS